MPGGRSRPPGPRHATRPFPRTLRVLAPTWRAAEREQFADPATDPGRVGVVRAVVAIWIRLPQVSSKTAVVTGPIAVGGWVKRTPRATRRSCSAWTSATANDVYGMPSATSASLNGPTAGWSDGSSSSSVPSGCSGDDDGQPAVLAQRDVVLRHEAEHVGVERQRRGLVVDRDARQVDPHALLLAGRPALRDVLQRRRVEVVELVATVASAAHQPGVLQHREVLRDRLPGRAPARASSPAGRRSRTASGRRARSARRGSPGGSGRRAP